MSAGLNNWFCCTYWTKKKSHLGTSYDVAHLAELTPVVQKMDLTHPLNKSLSSG